MTILVIGTGAIGQRHANNLRLLGEDVEMFSMQESDLVDLQSALKPDAFEAAILCTATQIRNEVISLLASANLPIYIEKPLAFQADELEQTFSLLNTLAMRSFVGYMMRYHPAVRWLVDQDMSDIFRYDFAIGHDVNLWRANWSFKDSYACDPNGGGVLLDLCHELDMAHLIFKGSQIASVTSTAGPDFDRVDFATSVSLKSDSSHGIVSMDYLCPVSTRIFRAFGKGRVITFDFANDKYTVDTKEGTETLKLSIDRQLMFQRAMKDFLLLIRGETPENPIAPILYKERKSCQFICDAYEQRKFEGKLRS